MIYLDNNATTRPAPAVTEAVLRGLTELWQNPSSVHRSGQAVRHGVELARSRVAALINARPREVILTGGGTESIELAIRGSLAAFARRAPGVRPAIVTTAVEHAAVRDLAALLAEDESGPEVRLVPLGDGGVVEASALPGLLDDRVAVVSVQWANNETGAIQPVEAVGRLCRERRVAFHVDGTQWVGKMPTDFGSGTAREADAAHADTAGRWMDLLSFAPHKFHGPKGVGALAVRRGTPLGVVRPGSQELGRRGGTEAVPAILGFGAACDEALSFLQDPAERDRLASLRDGFERRVLDGYPAAVRNRPAGGDRLWNTSNMAFPGLEAEALLLMLSERGVEASAGAACSSGSLEPSPVLLAMGLEPRLAHGSVRFSLSRWTTEQELAEAAAIVADSATRLAAVAPS